MDVEALKAVLQRYFDRMKAIVERHGGTVEKFIGDAVVAVFGVPVAHEDDALRSVRAASRSGFVPSVGRRLRVTMEMQTAIPARSRNGTGHAPCAGRQTLIAVGSASTRNAFRLFRSPPSSS